MKIFLGQQGNMKMWWLQYTKPRKISKNLNLLKTIEIDAKNSEINYLSDTLRPRTEDSSLSQEFSNFRRKHQIPVARYGTISYSIVYWVGRN